MAENPWKQSGTFCTSEMEDQINAAGMEEHNTHDYVFGWPIARKWFPGPLKETVTRLAYQLWPDQPSGMDWAVSCDGEFLYRVKEGSIQACQS